MLKSLAVSALALCCFGTGLSAGAAEVPANYNYPYTDPWLATASVAFLKDPKLPEKQVKDATLLPARARTPLFEDKARVYYVTYRQEKPADLVVLISGLGSVAEDPLALYLGGRIFAMGYNVIVVPDAFNWQFALGASTTGYVGIPSTDAADLEKFILHARDHAVKVDGMKVRQTKLVGYSMGALEGAFLAAREAQNPRLKFDKVVLINPPVDTFYDLHMLDALAATGANWSAEEKKTVKAHAFGLVANANLTDPEGAPYFRDLAQKNTLTDDQLKYVLFGLFRESLSDVIMVTQQIRDLGILKSPADKTHLDAREQEALQYGFEDYLAKFIAPQLGSKRTAQEMLKGETLYGLQDFLATHREVEIFHNADDFLVRPQDLNYLKTTLGARLTLFPRGGHMGNIWYPTNQQMLAQALSRGPIPDAPVAVPAPAPAAPTDAVATTPPANPAPEAQPVTAAVPPEATTAAAPVTPAAAPAPAEAPAPALAQGAPVPTPAPVSETVPTPAAPTALVPVAASTAPAPAAAGTPPVAPSAATALSPPTDVPVAPPVEAAPTTEVPAATTPAPVPTMVEVTPTASTVGEGQAPSSTTTVTTTAPPVSPTYTVKIPQIPSATPSIPGSSGAAPTPQ